MATSYRRDEMDSTIEVGKTVKKKSKKKKKGGFWNGFGKVIGTLFLTGILTCVVFGVIFWKYLDSVIIPNAHVDVEGITLAQSSTIVAFNKETQEWEEIQKLYADENRIPVTLDQVPDYVPKALISIEDKRFYQHHGVDWKSSGKAVLTMFFGSNNRGGSTLTQQLIKNLTGENQVIVKRKIQEIFRALDLEKNYTKEEIIEMYLNVVYFGHSCYGIGAASEVYFGKTVDQLTVAEAAAIIGITNSPAANDPLRSEKCRARCIKRQQLILDQMWDQGMFETEAEYHAAKDQKLIFVGDEGYVSQKSEDISGQESEYYSYFVDQVIRDVLAELQEQLGYSENQAKTLLYSSGLTVYCTMDPSIQNLVDEVYTDLDNFAYTSVSGQQLQSAFTIMNPYTGDILAMSGGVGEKEGSLVTNRAAAKRPCGSAVKPLSVYSVALEDKLISEATVIDDYPVEYNKDSKRAWPKNVYAGFLGLSTLRYALEQSINTCAVRTVSQVGLLRSYQWMTNNLGFTSIGEDDINSSALGLGGFQQGVTNIEMCAAYSAFVNSGIYTSPRTFSKIEDHNGQTILNNETYSNVAMSIDTCYTMNRLLQSVVTNGTGYAARLNNMTMAGKTGTTSNAYDRYFVGYTPYYCAAVWCGYDYMEKMTVDSTFCPKIWKKIMGPLHEGLENLKFDSEAASKDFVDVTVCTKSGLLPTETCRACGHVQTVKVLPDQVPKTECTVHQAHTVCAYTSEDGKTTIYCEPSGNCEAAGSTKSVVLYNYKRDLVFNVGDEEGRPPKREETDDTFNDYAHVRDYWMYIPELLPCKEHMTEWEKEGKTFDEWIILHPDYGKTDEPEEPPETEEPSSTDDS